MGLQAFWHVAESCIRSNPPTLTCHKHCKFGAPESLELSGVPMVPIDVTLVVVVVEGSFLEECLRRGSPHPACFNGERNKGDMCGRNILPPLDSLIPRILFLFLSCFRLAPRPGIRCKTVVARYRRHLPRYTTVDDVICEPVGRRAQYVRYTPRSIAFAYYS